MITLSVRQSSSPSPPSLVFQNSLDRQFIHNKYVVSRWSSGNRRRATSAREVIEVAGSNHAIGVILNLAWGPNNFSPSMIWSLRTRSNSQTGLGAEELLPAKLRFCFCCFSSTFYSSSSSFLSSFFLFPSTVSEQFSFSGHFVNC